MTQILNRYTGAVIAEGEMSLRELVLHVVKTARDKGMLADLRGSDLTGSDLRGSDLRGSDLSGSDLRYSDLSGSDLSGSDLSGSNLRGSNLRGSDLSGSNLRGSNLAGSNLSGSDLSGSNLRGSDLAGSDLTGINLRGSNLSGSDLDYSAWPLRCSSNHAIVCDKIASQLLYHAFAVAKIKPTKAQIKFMQDNFHRYDECGGENTLTRSEVKNG